MLYNVGKPKKLMKIEDSTSVFTIRIQNYSYDLAIINSDKKILRKHHSNPPVWEYQKDYENRLYIWWNKTSCKIKKNIINDFFIYKKTNNINQDKKSISLLLEAINEWEQNKQK